MDQFEYVLAHDKTWEEISIGFILPKGGISKHKVISFMVSMKDTC